jgi:hypothetical protein
VHMRWPITVATHRLQQLFRLATGLGSSRRSL